MKTTANITVYTGLIDSNGAMITETHTSLREAKRVVRSLRSLGIAAKAFNAAGEQVS